VLNYLLAPEIREPFPQYLVDLMAKNVAGGLFAIQEAIRLSPDLKLDKGKFNFFHSSSRAFKKRLTNLERSNFNLEPFLKQVLIGTLIGDAHMRKFSDKANARLVFRQGAKNASYLFHLYDLFKEYVLTPPKLTKVTDKKTGELRYNLNFASLALPCFNELYELFYNLENKKIIPKNIGDLLTPVSLAY